MMTAMNRRHFIGSAAAAAGALAIGRLKVGKARIGKLRIDELEIGRVTHIGEAAE